MSILSIIQACTRLESLRLCLENKSTISLFSEVLDVAELHEEGDEDEDEDEKRSNDDAGSEEGDSALINNVVKMRKTGLRELSVCLPPASHGPSTLKSLLRQCPRLETLYLEHLEDARAIQEITNVLQGGRCPRLKNLRLGRVGKYEDSDEIVTLLLRSLKTRRISSTSGTSSSNGIKNNNDDSNDDGYNGRGGLQSFAVVDGEYQDAIFRKKYILSLVRYHAKTLTAIDFSMHPLKIHYFVHLVSGLPNLRTVLSKVLLKPRSEDESDLDQVFKKDWACLGVTHLDLDLSQACKIKSVEDPSWKGSVADRCISYIFPQIGRITELKEWSLGGKVDLLSLDDGYLELLAGLKRLDTLRLNRWSDYRMGAKEADWMLENWPQLRRIELFHQVMPEELPESEQLALQLFVSRLNSEKPWLRIS
ncbi:hypothetical protein BGX26_001683 [Mortierella sp. AD094]|nr:hypothetical protein BGX26_001683 [Mortierella sp. AD094]